MSNKTIIYFVRHGSVDLKDGEAVEQDPPLNYNGRKQSVFLAKQFYDSNEKIDLILTSNMKRSIQTAEILCKKLAKKSTPFLDFGEFSRKFFNSSIFSFIFIKNFIKYKRALKLFNKLLIENKGKTMLLVIHGNVIRSLVGNKLNIPFKEMGKLGTNNAHITRLTFIGNKLSTLSYVNSKILI